MADMTPRQVTMFARPRAQDREVLSGFRALSKGPRPGRSAKSPGDGEARVEAIWKLPLILGGSHPWAL